MSPPLFGLGTTSYAPDCRSFRVPNIAIFSTAVVAWSSLLCATVFADSKKIEHFSELLTTPGVVVNPEAMINEITTLLESQVFKEDTVILKALECRAMALERRRDFAKAIQDYEQILRRQPQNRDARLARARLLSFVGKHNESEKEVLSILQDHPRYALAYAALATTNKFAKDHKRAIENASRAIKLDPTCTAAYYVRALIFHATEQFDRALPDIEKFIELSPFLHFFGPEDAFVMRGHCHYKLGHLNQAISDFQIGLRLNPTSFNAAYGLWHVYIDGGKKHCALHFATELTRLQAKDARGYLALAASCWSLEDVPGEVDPILWTTNRLS